MGEAEELSTGTIFRLGPQTPQFGDPAEKPRPDQVCSLFELSSSDKDCDPPLLSVFDRDRTHPREAADIRQVPLGRVLALFVEDVILLRIPGSAKEHLRVLRDPLAHPLSALPGADGHCGILGLFRQAGVEKVLFKDLRMELSRRAFWLNDHSP